MDGPIAAYAAALLYSIIVSSDPRVVTACVRASPPKAVNGAMTSTTLWKSLFHRLPSRVKQKNYLGLAPSRPAPVARRGLLGAALYAGYWLPREPPLASHIAADVAYLTAVVQMVEEDHGEPGPNFSRIATPRRGEIPVKVSLRFEPVSASGTGKTLIAFNASAESLMTLFARRSQASKTSQSVGA